MRRHLPGERASRRDAARAQRRAETRKRPGGAARWPCSRYNDSECRVHVQRDFAMFGVTLQEAQARLPELLKQLQPGEEITITDDGQSLA